MSGRVMAAVCVIAMALAVNPLGKVASADEGGSATGGSDGTTGEISAVAGTETSGGRSVSDSRPACRFTPFDNATSQVPGAGEGIVRRDATTKQTLAGVPAGANTETLYLRSCPGKEPTYVWVPDGVDVEDVLASAREEVSEQLPDPALEMSPDPAVGGTVNVGLWLAVADPGDVSVTASVGPVWASVTARFVGTSWAMGNGDTVECEGLGSPIVELDTADEGPCGYTYRWPSAPEFTGTGDRAYHASVVGHWEITYVTSTGSAGSLPALDRTTEFSYEVRELQTVRVSADG